MRKTRIVTASASAFAAFAVVWGQLFALSHEITVRHVPCAEHGELTHLATVSGAEPVEPSAVDALGSQEAAPKSAHEHCATALTLRVSVTSKRPPIGLPSVPPPPIFSLPSGAPPRDRAFLLASAPKTSPPSA